MPADDAPLAVADEAGQARGEGLPGIGVALGGQQKALAGEAKAHVQEDEHADDEAVAADGAGADLLVQERLGVLLEPGVARQEAARQENHHAEQDQDRQHVGDEPVEPAQQAEVEPGGPGARQVAVQQVEEVDQQVDDEAVEDEAVKEAHQRTVAKDGGLREAAGHRRGKAARQRVEAGKVVPLAAPHRQHHAAKAGVGEGEGHASQDQEQEFLGDAEHALSLQEAGPDAKNVGGPV